MIIPVEKIDGFRRFDKTRWPKRVEHEQQHEQKMFFMKKYSNQMFIIMNEFKKLTWKHFVINKEY